MSTHLLSVRLTVVNSEVTGLQKVDLDVEFLPETDPLIVELRRAWAEHEATQLAQARARTGDLFTTL